METAWDRRALLGGLGAAAGLAGPAYAGLFDPKKDKSAPKPDDKAKAQAEADNSEPAYFNTGPLARNMVANDFCAPLQPIALPPKLSFMGPKEGPHTLEDYRGKTIMLSLWAEWCQWCLLEMPVFDKLNEKLGTDKFEIVTVLTSSYNFEGWKSTRKFLDTRMDCKHLPALVENGDRLTRFLAKSKENPTGALPCNVLIDPQGRIRARCVGASTYMYKDRKVTTWASEDGIAFYRSLANGLLA